jgi:hypothetical protein
LHPLVRQLEGLSPEALERLRERADGGRPLFLLHLLRQEGGCQGAEVRARLDAEFES